MIVEDDPPHGRIDEISLEGDDFGVQDALVVISVAEVNHFPAVAKANGREGFHFTHLQGQQHFLTAAESASLSPGPRLGHGQVVAAQNHVLGGNGDRDAVRGRQYVVG